MSDIPPDVTTTTVTVASILTAIGAGIWKLLSVQRAKVVVSEGDSPAPPSIAVYPIEYGRRLYDYKAAFDAHVLLMAQFRKDYEEHLGRLEPMFSDYILRGEKIASLERDGERDRASEVRDRVNGASSLEKAELRLEKRLEKLETRVDRELEVRRT